MTSSAPLNAEPAIPAEREAQHLPPKSYKDAVEEDVPAEEIVSAENGTSGTTGNGHAAKVLRIVDTGAPVEKEKERAEERPVVQRQESKREYSATGGDDTIRTPPRRKNFKHESKGSPSPDKSKSKPKTAEKTNGDSQPKDSKPQNSVIFEKVEGQTNGSKLTTIKAPAYEQQLAVDKKEAPSLASGRKAGQRWETSAIRFAPMNVPLQRRLQTCVVLWHTLCIAIAVSTFFFLCAIPLFWPLLIPYMIYCMTSTASTNGLLKHRSEFLRSSPVWSLFASYFPARLHRTQELPATRKYIFGYHPHGIISHGAFAAFGTESLGFSQLFPGIKNTLLTLDSNFRIPLYRDYALAMGLASVSKESCENLLSKGGPNGEGMGRAITIVVGGARESLDAQPYSLRLVLARRKGFIKLALRNGADLVPVLAFGENDLYDQVTSQSHPRIHRIQLLAKKLLGFTIPLFHARGVFNYDVGLMPYRRPLNVVVGRPIRVERDEKPSQEVIERVHGEYVEELCRLWETWKGDFAKERKGELDIVE